MKQYDAIIIGFGKGGKLLAAELAERNWKVAIVERSPQMYGGTCVNVGCIPTKALIHESEYAEKDTMTIIRTSPNCMHLPWRGKTSLDPSCVRKIMKM